MDCDHPSASRGGSRSHERGIQGQPDRSRLAEALSFAAETAAAASWAASGLPRPFRDGSPSVGQILEKAVRISEDISEQMSARRAADDVLEDEESWRMTHGSSKVDEDHDLESNGERG
jgi:hypothetical protein